MSADTLFKMSAEEREFVVAYIRVLRPDFWRVQTVLNLMSESTGLGITDLSHAIELADKIGYLHIEFEYNLFDTAKHLWKSPAESKAIDMPTVDQLAELFTLSFFKIVSVSTENFAGAPQKTDNGWSSGAPGTVTAALDLLDAGFFDKKPDEASAAEAEAPDAKDAAASNIAAVVLDLLTKLFDTPPGGGTVDPFTDLLPYFSPPYTTSNNDNESYLEDDEYYEDEDDEDDWGGGYESYSDDDYDDN